MRLLIVTQKVDKDDPVLGFFCRWILEFAAHCEHVDVICLWEGAHDFQSDRWCGSVKNVRVHSLGKERGISKLKQLKRFRVFCRRLSSEANGVFVHMNAIYVPLGWPWWGRGKKKVLLWRNHPQGGWLASLAYRLCGHVAYTSPDAHAARFPGAERMPAGIDTIRFRRNPAISRKPGAFLYLGRISPIKRIEVIIEAARMLYKTGAAFTLSIIGSPTNPSDAEYAQRLKQVSEDLIAQGVIAFHPAVAPDEAAHIFNAHPFFINATPLGSYDKTVLEAMACESLPIVTNRSFADVLAKELVSGDSAAELAERMRHILMMPESARAEIVKRARDTVVATHTLLLLVRRVLAALSP